MDSNIVVCLVDKVRECTVWLLPEKKKQQQMKIISNEIGNFTSMSFKKQLCD